MQVLAASHEFQDPEHFGAAIQGATLAPCQLSRSPVTSSITRVQCPRLGLDLIRAGAAMHYEGEMPGDCYTLSFVSHCPGTGRSFNFDTEFGSGYMGFFSPGLELDAYNPANCSNAILTIQADLFHSILETSFPEIPARVLRRGAGLRVGERQNASLNDLLRALRQSTTHSPEVTLASVSPCDLAEDLLGGFLEALRSGCETPLRTPGPRITNRHRRFRAARDFLNARQHKPVHLSDLCKQTGLSQRGVENLFQDFLGVGPNTYLRLRRLHAAHRALRATHATHGAVKRIAYESGFWHLGRFARDYKSIFNESPSKTLGAAAN